MGENPARMAAFGNSIRAYDRRILRSAGQRARAGGRGVVAYLMTASLTGATAARVRPDLPVLPAQALERCQRGPVPEDLKATA